MRVKRWEADGVLSSPYSSASSSFSKLCKTPKISKLPKKTRNKMECFRSPKSLRIPISFILCNFIFFFVFLLSGSSSVEAYKNYTVGDSLGWYDNLQKPTVHYQKWAAGKTFSLGDFLIFNTDNNHSVVQTYNFTTYKRCDFDNADTDDTTERSATDPSSTTPHQVTVPVPLLKEGMTYFFSGDYDGEQCKNGQHFKINVTHGEGLPESLRSSSVDQSPSPNASPADGGDGDDDSSTPQPVTVVSSDFDHPKDGDQDQDGDKNVKKTSGSDSYLGRQLSFLGLRINVVLGFLLGLILIFGFL